MRCKDARLLNLRKLVSEFGTVAAVAKRTGTSEVHLRNILNAAKNESGSVKAIGDDLAEKLESAYKDRFPGWFDVTLSEEETELLTVFKQATAEIRAQIFNIAVALTHPGSVTDFTKALYTSTVISPEIRNGQQGGDQEKEKPNEGYKKR